MDEMYCDFYLPCGKVYIEFWGLENDKKYVERKAKKQRLYAENGLNLIQIDDKILENLDDFFAKRAIKIWNKFGLNFRNFQDILHQNRHFKFRNLFSF